MLLWYILGLMTGLALLPILGLIYRRVQGAEEAGHERKVYEDQLTALEAEAERGLIDKQELEAARVEISKRLLAAADRPKQASAPVSPIGWTMIAVGCAGIVVLVALGGYMLLGRPDLIASAPTPAAPQQAASGQGVPGEAEMAARLADVEAKLEADPKDGIAWEEAAALNFALGRYGESSRAYARAIEILGESAQRLGDYGEALTQASGSVVSDAAKAIFEKAMKLDPKLVQARFYLALANEQSGDFAKAAKAYAAMLEDAPEGAFWMPLVEQRLAAVNVNLGKPAPAPDMAPQTAPSAPPTAGPSAEDMSAAQQMSEGERDDMVTDMVTRLAARLEQDGNDVDGWLMLMRSYMVLDRRDDARSAANSAREQFAGDAAALKRIDEAVQALGIAQ